jgi:diguanylate cyclase (GGDEF)-like protein
MTAIARIEDTVGRRGGDEFTWILPDTNAEDALAAVERARETIAQQHVGDAQLTISVGVADTTDATSADELLRMADVALYASKTAGRDRSSAYGAHAVEL